MQLFQAGHDFRHVDLAAHEGLKDRFAFRVGKNTLYPIVRVRTA
jgi:hypothetical protein